MSLEQAGRLISDFAMHATPSVARASNRCARMRAMRSMLDFKKTSES